MEQIILAVITSSALTAIITFVFSKRKTDAETDLFKATAYGKMLEDLRKQIDFLTDQMKLMGVNIKNLQDKEVEYLKIISNHQKTERELRNRIKELENTLNNHLKTLN